MANFYNESSLKEIIPALFSQYNLNYGLDKVEIAGMGVVKYTENVRLQGDKLFISLNNASLREDLNLRRSELVQLINDFLKKEVVKEIVIS